MERISELLKKQANQILIFINRKLPRKLPPGMTANRAEKRSICSTTAKPCRRQSRLASPEITLCQQRTLANRYALRACPAGSPACLRPFALKLVCRSVSKKECVFRSLQISFAYQKILESLSNIYLSVSATYFVFIL